MSSSPNDKGQSSIDRLESSDNQPIDKAHCTPRKELQGRFPEVVEVRGFGLLTEVFKRNNWTVPLKFELTKPCTAAELAKRIGLPLDKIEAVFINRKVESLNEGFVNPGDRVSFIPIGVPGPYRVLLGITKLPADSDS